jgi:hypothetical protein
MRHLAIFPLIADYAPQLIDSNAIRRFDPSLRAGPPASGRPPDLAHHKSLAVIEWMDRSKHTRRNGGSVLISWHRR